MKAPVSHEGISPFVGHCTSVRVSGVSLKYGGRYFRFFCSKKLERGPVCCLSVTVGLLDLLERKSGGPGGPWPPPAAFIISMMKSGGPVAMLKLQRVSNSVRPLMTGNIRKSRHLLIFIVAKQKPPD